MTLDSSAAAESSTLIAFIRHYFPAISIQILSQFSFSYVAVAV